jgi:hypothetical protein
MEALRFGMKMARREMAMLLEEAPDANAGVTAFALA